MLNIRPHIILCSFLFLQIIFWLGIPTYWVGLRNIEPNYVVVSPVPSDTTVKALSFGDDAFMFHTLALRLQTMGDSYGRFTPLINYDYAMLYRWFLLLDRLNPQSHFTPALAGYIFAQTPKHDDVRYVVDYLYQHGQKDIEHKWWWLTQAIYLAYYKLKDPQLALKIAYVLYHAPEHITLPIWARQMAAFIHAGLNEQEAALAIIHEIIKNLDNIPPNEITFMNHFIQERLGYSDQTVEHIRGH